VRIADVVEGERVAASGSLCDKEDDLLLGVLELQLFEQYEADVAEPFAEPAADRLGIGDGKKLRRDDHCQSALRLEKCRSVHEQRRPGRGEAVESNPLRERGGGGTLASLDSVVLVA